MRKELYTVIQIWGWIKISIEMEEISTEKNGHNDSESLIQEHTFGMNYLLTLSQTTNFRLFQTKRVCRRQFQIL